jgi:PAS domain S-box-containing protein
MEKTVLVVDDDADLRDNLIDILRDEGYHPLPAASCAEALELAGKRNPMVALIDLKLPDGPGTDLLAGLKQDCPDCICMMITAFADLDTALIALEQGAYQYFQKPVHPVELLQHLKKAFDNIQLREDQRDTQRQLKESEERFRELAELLPEIIYEMDPDVRLTFVNRRAFELFGYTQQEFEKGLNALDMIVPEERPKAVEAMKRVLSGRDSRLNEYTALRKDGSTFPILIRSTRLLKDGRPVGTRGLIIDVSEKKQLESQLIQAQKMEAIGTLAGGIAHDFNNMMMGIQGRTSLMLMDVHTAHPHFEHLTSIQNYVKSAAELTKQLLGFARGGKYQVKPLDINKLIVDSSGLFGRTKKEIQIHIKLPDDIRTVMADQAQIEQVLLNLYLNAWQAMSGGGELYLQTENIHLSEQAVEPYDVKPGPYVEIAVTDTGIGMNEKVRRRIFDPFFTTKNIGRGTGLGLASAYGIIRSHGGFIKVSSTRGKGSTFRIYLPASGEEIRPDAGIREEIFKGGETLLLVDDEEMIIDIGQKMLERLGYKVLVAHGGKEALEVYQRHRQRIQLIVLDVVMPEMGGKQVFELLKKIDPKLKVLLASGYSMEGEAKEIMDQGCDGFIQKPFNMHELSQKLRSILEK